MSSKLVKWLGPLLLVVATLNVYGSTCEFSITTRDKRVFNVTVTYELDKAYAGNQYFQFEVSVTSNNGSAADLVLKECKPPDGARLETRLESSGEARYRCVVNIKNEADPRRYRIDFISQYADQSFTTNCLLAVGVRTNKDAGGIDRVSIKPTANPVEFQASRRNEFPFDIHNSFPDYPAVIKSVTFTASRPDLITNSEVSYLEAGSNQIDPLQTTHANAKFDVAGMTLRDLLIGFPDKAHLNVDVTYTDGFGRTISDLHQEFPITLRPRDRVLYLAIVIGVIAGALIKIYLQRLKSQGVINNREVFKAVSTTVLIGLVVSIIALAGQIKVTAFELTGSYDKPIVIFVIGLTGALVGAQLLMSLIDRWGGKAETKDL
jgi:hypothetical protein